MRTRNAKAGYFNFEKLTGYRNRCVIQMGMLTANFTIDEIKAKVKIRVASMKYQSIPLIMGYP
ncbi:hypothetical protein V1477_018423 [Vespula maculifrons]|uniref:Uncharacterized protein n=1 Tax=Vespula maculifrons TaxID=7453 RepID=A0ABD2AVB1_VESMC